MNRYFSIIILGIFFGAFTVSANEDPQRERLRATLDSALDVIYADCCEHVSAEEKQAQVREVVESSYDLDVIIRSAIGRNWRLMSEEEQQEVLELVKQIVVKLCVSILDGGERPEITLGDFNALTERRGEIESSILFGGETYNAVFRLRKMSSGWQIYDIVAENISFVSNYREQMDDHFRKGTGAELITRLEELLEQDEINEDTKI